MNNNCWKKLRLYLEMNTKQELTKRLAYKLRIFMLYLLCKCNVALILFEMDTHKTYAGLMYIYILYCGLVY